MEKIYGRSSKIKTGDSTTKFYMYNNSPGHVRCPDLSYGTSTVNFDSRLIGKQSLILRGARA